ncbi:hypothetical protein F4818DRAFT_454486 [Hypoxylon cercidicola]|nr:hypothetical protein F4818DRAFT_454486 [Hypoxylon cercidicola]
MMGDDKRVRSVTVVGAGAITAAALKAENYFERIQVYERRETPRGTWILESDPKLSRPGRLPPDVDPPLEIPKQLPQIAPPNQQERFSTTPIYNSLTTNVLDIAPRQYVENYFSQHQTDGLLVLNTTVEDITKLQSGPEKWRLALRRYDPACHVDVWWQETFDAVILANGHYSVPYIPHVPGLEEYAQKFPGRVMHSKYYRSPHPYAGKRILVIGNGKDATVLGKKEQVHGQDNEWVLVERQHKDLQAFI